MKKLLALFTLLLLVTSCAKEADVSQGTLSGEALTITASVVDMTGTKATLINSWSGGEQVALFVGDELYQYSVAEDGTMSGDDIIIDRKAELTYTSFYPYDATLSTIEEYQVACTAGHVDYMSATTTTTGTAVELQFSHLLAALSFTVVVESEAADPAISLALDGDFSNTIVLEVDATIGWIASKLEANYFVEEGADISSAVIKVDQNGSTTFHSIAQKDTNIVEVGKQYQFYCTIGDITIDSELGISAGSGTIDDPFLIYTADAMRNVGTGIVDWELSSHYKLCDNIDLEGVEFTPIGSSSEMFTGSLDGDGYSITGLQITGSEAGQGLFKYTSGATIKNLKVGGTVTNSSGETAGLIIGYAKNNTTITDCETLSGSIVTNSGGNNAAGIVAHITDGATVTNCINRATINGQKYSSGIAGYCSNSTTTFTNCTNEGDITNTSSSDYTGGILAKNFSNHKITYCSNSGTISGAQYTGGIVGYKDYGTVSYCENSGSVSGSSDYVGGIIGYNNYSTVSYCENSGSVSGSSDILGGIIGYNSYSTVSYCENSGSVTGSGSGSSTFTAGIIGYNYGGNISSCENSGVVKANGRSGGIIGGNTHNGSISNCYNTGSVSGSGSVGGVIAYNYNSYATYCYNTGTITGTDNYYTGGVIGYSCYNCKVTECYNTGSVTGSNCYYTGGVSGYNDDNSELSSCYNTGSVTGSKSATGGVTGVTARSSKTTYCYNTGSVSGSSSLGGVSGTNSATISYCYYDKTEIGSIGAVDSADGTTYYGLTTTEMQGDASTEGTMLYYFSGSTSWTADDATNPINGGYPILTWQTSNN